MSETVPAAAPATPAPGAQATPAAAPALAPSPVAPALAPEAAPPPAEATVIGDALTPPPEQNPAEQPPEQLQPTETPKVEGQSEEPAPLPTYEAFTLPETVKLDETKLGEFTGLLGEFESKTKADHAATQAFGQKLVDYHVSEMQRLASDMQKQSELQRFAEREQWKKDFMADPELGGNRSQTTVDAALKFLRTHGGSDVEQQQFRELMDKSGVGNHPAMIRLLARAGQAMSEGRPLAAQQPAQMKLTRTQKMYGKA